MIYKCHKKLIEHIFESTFNYFMIYNENSLLNFLSYISKEINNFKILQLITTI